MDDLVKANLVVVRRTDFWIEVEIRTDILFPSASAQLEPQAVGVIEKLGEALAPYPNPIRVEGHTDDRPIKTVAFISNWELSAARAGSVVRVLASKGVAPSRLAVIGYGENRPSKGNDTIDGRNANRRVVVVILSADAASALSPSGSKPGEGTQAAVDGSAPGAPGVKYTRCSGLHHAGHNRGGRQSAGFLRDAGSANRSLGSGRRDSTLRNDYDFNDRADAGADRSQRTECDARPIQSARRSERSTASLQ